MIKPLKFWCQKVLPAVYDDSLSYYEVLNKINEKLNEVIESENNLTTSMATLAQQMTEFDANVDEKLDALEASLTEQIETVDGRVTTLYQSLNESIAALRTETATELANKANKVSPIFSGDMKVGGTAWFGGLPKVGGTGFTDPLATELATKSYVEDAVSSATGVTIATGTFTPDFTMGVGYFDIKQLGDFVLFQAYFGIDNGTIADLQNGQLGIITNVNNPRRAMLMNAMTSNGTDFHPAVLTMGGYNDRTVVSISGVQTDSVIMLNGVYFVN